MNFKDGKDIHGFAKVSDARVAVARVGDARFADAPLTDARLLRMAKIFIDLQKFSLREIL